MFRKLPTLLITGVFAAAGCTHSPKAPREPSSSYPPEPVPAGCQNLDEIAAKSKPLKLGGKIYLTYLPEGRRYNKLKEPAAGPDHWEVGLLDLDKGTPIQRLTRDEVHDAEVRVSPDGKRIVWSKRPALDFFDGENAIIVANVDLTGQKVLAHGPNHYYGIPSFSKPGGDKVLYVSQGERDRASKLMIADLKTGQARPLKTSFKGNISDPQMSRDGKKIVFKSANPRDEENINLFIMDSNGRNVRQLTHDDDYADEDPAFSPDDRFVAFERMYGPSKHKGDVKNDWFFKVGVVLLDLKTGREKALTEPDPCGKNELWLPTWSPDGELLMFTRGLHMQNGDFTHDLWVMRKDGSDLQRVPHSDGAMFIDWVP